MVKTIECFVKEIEECLSGNVRYLPGYGRKALSKKYDLQRIDSGVLQAVSAEVTVSWEAVDDENGFAPAVAKIFVDAFKRSNSIITRVEYVADPYNGTLNCLYYTIRCFGYCIGS